MYFSLVPFSFLVVRKMPSNFLKFYVIFLSIKSYTRIGHWNSESVLFEKDLSCGSLKTAINSFNIESQNSHSRQKTWQIIDYLLRSRSSELENSKVQYSLGLAYDEIGNHQKSSQAYLKATQLQPNFLQAWNKLAHSTRNQSFYRNAVQISKESSSLPSTIFYEEKFTALQELSSKSPFFKNELCEIVNPDEDWTYANCLHLISPENKTSCDFAIENTNFDSWMDNYSYGLTIGKFCRTSRQNEKAAQIYSELLKRHWLSRDRKSILYTNIGGIHQIDRDFEIAAQFYKKALKENPENCMARKNLNGLIKS